MSTKKIQRACDQCRCRKIRCHSYNGEPCTNCISKAVPCTWVIPVGKRGPKPRTGSNLPGSEVTVFNFDPTGPHHKDIAVKPKSKFKFKNKMNLTLAIPFSEKYINPTFINFFGSETIVEEPELVSNSSMSITPAETSPSVSCFPADVDDKHIVNYFLACTDFGIKGFLTKSMLVELWQDVPSISASFLFFSIASYSLVNGALDAIQGFYEPSPIHSPYAQKIISYYHCQAKQLASLFPINHKDEMHTLAQSLLSFVDECCHYPN